MLPVRCLCLCLCLWLSLGTLLLLATSQPSSPRPSRPSRPPSSLSPSLSIAGNPLAAISPQDDDIYRDFLFKLPTKDYRTKFGEEVFRFPHQKIALLLHTSSSSAALLTTILQAINFHRHEVDVIFFYRSESVQDINLHCPLCHKMLTVEDGTWARTEQYLLGRLYDTLVLLPSGDHAMDQRIISMTITRPRLHLRQDTTAAASDVSTRGGDRSRGRGMAHQSLLVPPAQQQLAHSAPPTIHSDSWLSLSQAFDYCLFWGSTSDYASEVSSSGAGAGMHNQNASGSASSSSSSCRILASQEAQQEQQGQGGLNSLFLNKVFCLLRKLTQLSLSLSEQEGQEGGEGGAQRKAVWNLDAVKLVKPSSVFKEMDSKVYIKASFGWEVLSWGSEPHRQFAQKFYEVLRIPLQYLPTSSNASSSSEDVGHVLDLKSSSRGDLQRARALWSVACEERERVVSTSRSSSSSSSSSSLRHAHVYAVDEICPPPRRPVLAHPDLLVSQWYQAYTAEYATSILLQVWRDEGEGEGDRHWRQVLRQVFATYGHEVIDQFILGISVGQLQGRLARPVVPQASDMMLQLQLPEEGEKEDGVAGVQWSPPLGRVRPQELRLEAMYAEEFVEVCAVNEDTKEVLIRTDNNSYFVFHFKYLVTSLDIREGDDLGVMACSYVLRYGLQDTHTLSQALLDHPLGMGSAAAVRSRRPSVPGWLQDDSYFLLPAPEVSEGSSSSSLPSSSLPSSSLPSLSPEKFFDPAYNPEPILTQMDKEVNNDQETAATAASAVSCDRSLLTKYLNVSAVHSAEVEAVRNGTHFHRAAAVAEAEAEAAGRNRRGSSGDDSSHSMLEVEESEEESFTIAMTTCRRLKHFLSVADHVKNIVFSYSHIFVTEILVVDDGSSLEDRQAMLLAFPNFVFVFKSDQSRGHASSLNMIMRLVDARFMVYLEDDWQLLPSPVLAPALRAALPSSSPPSPLLLQELIRLSIQVIRDSLRDRNNASYVPEPVAQVFFNDQRTRRCALGKLEMDSDTCEGKLFCRHCDTQDIGRGGWPREAAAAAVPDEQGQEGGQEGSAAAATIPYSLHEFGVLYEVWEDRMHGHTTWPGLGLNPAVWDLSQIRVAWSNFLPCERASPPSSPPLLVSEDLLYSNLHFRTTNNPNDHIFDESDEAFEHLFSLVAHVAGLNAAFLPAETFLHIGDVSAYVLNNFTRPWEFEV